MPAFSHFNGALRYAAEGILNALQQQPAEQPEKVAWRPQEGDKVRVIPRNPAYQPHLATYHGPQGEDMYGEDVHHVRGVNNGVRLSIAVQGSRIEHPEHRGVTIGDLMPAAQQPAPAAQPQSESHEDTGEQWRAGWQPVPGERVRYYDSRTGQDRHVIYNGMTPHGHANVDILAPRQSHHDPSDVQSNNVVPVRALERIHSSAGLVDSNRNRIEVGSQFHIEGTERPWTLTAVDQGAAIAWLSQPTSDAEGAPRRHNYVHVQRSISGDYHYMPGRQTTRLDDAQPTQQQQQWRPQVGERVRIALRTSGTHGSDGDYQHYIYDTPARNDAHYVRIIDPRNGTSVGRQAVGAERILHLTQDIRMAPGSPASAAQQQPAAAPAQREAWPPTRGRGVRVLSLMGDSFIPGSHTYSHAHQPDGRYHFVHMRDASGRDLGVSDVHESRIFHPSRDINLAGGSRGAQQQNPQQQSSAQSVWRPQPGEFVRIGDRSVLSQPGAGAPGEEYQARYVGPDSGSSGDRHRYETVHSASGRVLGSGSVHLSELWHHTKDVNPGSQLSPAQSGTRLEQLLHKVYGVDRAPSKAQEVRQHFARIFQRNVPDWVILKALRVPMTYLGADPKLPHYDARNLEMHVVTTDPGSISAAVTSRVPGYDFVAKTSVRKDKIYNSYQHHDGESGTDAKHISTPHILLNQADAAHALGIPQLEVSAAMTHSWSRKGDYTGGIVWPRYGYNANIRDVIEREARERVHQFMIANGYRGSSPTLHDVMMTPGGYELLSHFEPKPNGARHYINAPSGHMEFDTAPDSVSRKILAERIASVERGGKRVKK